MKKTVLLYSAIPQDLQAVLQKEFNLLYLPSADEPEFDQYLGQAHGLIGWGGGAIPQINDQLLAKAPLLEAVSTISVGYDHCDVPALTRRKVLLTNTPEVLTDTTADTIFGLLIATARRFVELDKAVRQGLWTRPLGDIYPGDDVHHKTIGILGLGRIGQAVAKRAHLGFDMRVLYTSNQPKPDAEKKYQAQRGSLEEVLKASDFVVITLSLNQGTRHLINAERLALMKPSAMLINGARGAIVDEKALIHALSAKTIAAAGLDVFEQEPLPLDSPLLKMDNVVLLPHIGSASRQTRYAMVKLGVENLVAVLNGHTERNCVNPEALA